MNIGQLSTIVLIALTLIVIERMWAVHRGEARNRLQSLSDNDAAEPEAASEDWSQTRHSLKRFGDRLGRAGYIDPKSRRRMKASFVAVVICTAASGLLIAVLSGLGSFGSLAASLGFGYCGVTAVAFLLKYFEKDYERELLFQTPIFLESLILLVESGLGILPSLDRLVGSTESTINDTPISRLYRLVYQLSASGMPFSQALETVANASPQKIVRHTLLHLDITGSEGGELIPSLRSLSDHAHAEWKLSVEQRVRRLENFVVFPVFASVIGLMLLTAAVPIAPLLDLKESLNQRPKAGQFDAVASISPKGE